MKALSLFFLLPLVSEMPSMRCENLAPVDAQGFPAVLEFAPSATEISLKVITKGAENSAVAKQGNTYLANRVATLEEARHGTPTYYVNDNPLGDRFANDERDTATYLFLDPHVLQGKDGKIRLWLHYRGEGYQGEEENSYACKGKKKQ